MPTSTSPRRSSRLRERTTAVKLDDFDYPGPKNNYIRSGRVGKPSRRNRRIPQQIIIISDDERHSTVDSSPTKSNLRRKPTLPSNTQENTVKQSSSRIAIGRVRKPIAGRNRPVKKNASFRPTPETDLSKSSPIALPTSPVSTQNSDDVISEEYDPVPTTANLSLGFQPDGPVVGREEESSRLMKSLSKALQVGQPSTGIYVCGTPGTGKTYTVSKVAKRIRASAANPSDKESSEVSAEEENLFKEVWVNCANLRQAKDLFSHLADRLDLDSSLQNPRESLRKYALSSGPKTLVILDEVDFLTSKDQMVLYSAFEWPRITDSRIVVVGIANSIDLPVRLLPWLRQAGCMPEVVSFAPYSAKALENIVQQRIDDIQATGLTGVAISLASKKVAAGSGDARLMLDICREAQHEMQRVKQDKNCISVVSSIISQRGGLSAAVETIRQLPVQQQLALCVAANAVVFSSGSLPGSGKAQKKASLGGLYNSFSRMCQRAHVSILAFPEFADICCNALTHHGLVDVPSNGRSKSAKTLRGRPIRLRVAVEDVRAGVADKGFLPMLLAK